LPVFARFTAILNVAVAFTFCHSTLLDVWSDNNRQQAAVKQFVLQNIDETELSDVQQNLITDKLKQFFGFINTNLPKCNRMLDRFKKKHAQWLASSIKIEFLKDDVPREKPGRKRLTYTEAGPRLKRKLASELANETENSMPLLLHAASVSAKKLKNDKTSLLLQKALNSANIDGIASQFDQNEITKISSEKALAFLIENNLTKQQYINIKAINKLHGCDIYPPYSELTKMKLKCRPEQDKITYSEFGLDSLELEEEFWDE